MLFCHLAADFSQNQHFRKILSEIQSECKTVWIQIRPQHFVEPDPDPNCLQSLLADDTIRQRAIS